MINGLNLVNINSFSTKKAEDKTRIKNGQPKNPSFGYADEYNNHPVRDLFLNLTNDVIGMFGFNAILWGVQDFVNGKVLIGKINKHFTKNIKDKEKLESLAFEMRDKKGLTGKVDMFQGADGQAYYTKLGNKVVVGKDQYAALFHELGHATIENNTKVLKSLQNFRGKYTVLSLALYALMSQREKTNQQDQGLGSKILNSDTVIPLLAFSPELITEAKASKIGLNFLKEKLKAGVIDKSLYSSIKRSYITCFATYLFIPVSIMLMEALRNGVSQKVNQKRQAYY